MGMSKTTKTEDLKRYIFMIENTTPDSNDKFIGVRTCSGPIEKDRYKGEDSKFIKKLFLQYGKKAFKKTILEEIPLKDSGEEKIKKYMTQYNAKDIQFVEPSKQVICLNTKKVYANAEEAAKKTNTSLNGIYQACNPNCSKETAGKGPDGKWQFWMRYDIYLQKVKELGEDFFNIDKIMKERTMLKVASAKTTGKKVICLNTGEVFNSIHEASKFYNINMTAISKAASPKYARRSAGKAANGEFFQWMLYDEYVQRKDELDKESRIMTFSAHKNARPVKCKETGKVYSSIKRAADSVGLNPGTILKSCRKGCRGGMDYSVSKPLHWEYISQEDYQRISNEIYDKENAQN